MKSFMARSHAGLVITALSIGWVSILEICQSEEAAVKNKEKTVFFAAKLHRANETQKAYFNGGSIGDFYLGEKTNNPHVFLAHFPQENEQRKMIENLLVQNIFALGYKKKYAVHDLINRGARIEDARMEFPVFVISDFAGFPPPQQNLEFLKIISPPRLFLGEKDKSNTFSVSISNPLKVRLLGGLLRIHLATGGRRYLQIENWRSSTESCPEDFTFELTLPPSETKSVEFSVNESEFVKAEKDTAFERADSQHFPTVSISFLGYGRDGQQLLPISCSQEVWYQGKSKSE